MALGKRWRVHHWADTYVVEVRWPDARSRESPRTEAARTEQALAMLVHGYRSDDLPVARVFEEVHQELFGCWQPFPLPTAHGSAHLRLRAAQLLGDLGTAARSGRLVVRPEVRASIHVRIEEVEAPAPPPVDTAEQLDDIEIAVVVDSGESLPGVRIELSLADGSMASGRTDDGGARRFEGVPAGDCTVTLPDFDPKFWKQLGSEALS
jgi:hypothetical protein